MADTLLIVGGVAATIGAAWWLNRQQLKGTPLPDPGGTPKSNAFVAPSDLLSRMMNGYRAKRARNGYRDSASRDEWIGWMQETVFHLPAPVWGYMFDQSTGYQLSNGGASASEPQYETWLNYAANEPSLQK